MQELIRRRNLTIPYLRISRLKRRQTAISRHTELVSLNWSVFEAFSPKLDSTRKCSINFSKFKNKQLPKRNKNNSFNSDLCCHCLSKLEDCLNSFMIKRNSKRRKSVYRFLLKGFPKVYGNISRYIDSKYFSITSSDVFQHYLLLVYPGYYFLTPN